MTLLAKPLLSKASHHYRQIYINQTYAKMAGRHADEILALSASHQLPDCMPEVRRFIMIEGYIIVPISDGCNYLRNLLLVSRGIAYIARPTLLKMNFTLIPCKVCFKMYKSSLNISDLLPCFDGFLMDF